MLTLDVSESENRKIGSDIEQWISFGWENMMLSVNTSWTRKAQLILRIFELSRASSVSLFR